ncbi:MAG TPA: dTDP-glucose 4,6-dehydratase [Actinomycetota bacterium]|jgi:dTDP-glucose 4,6-dehydratase|nr:dTDP-glucose 4,6-dehydratase [Actinomycetota bacterium]
MAERERILVTGGAGFIGSHLVDLLLERPDTDVVVLDKLTYAGTRANLATHDGDQRFTFVRGDVAEAGTVVPLVQDADRVIHAAAESFVDRSIEDSRAFVLSNVLGTQVVLEACREMETPLVFVSTDEVYGSNEAAPFREPDPMRPRNPYAASKAGADLLVHAYVVTYGLHASTVRGTNAYGPRQHPEKAIPTFATAALQGRPLPVYGQGSNRREWLYVRDFAAAIQVVMERGEPGGVYNIGGGTEMTNLELAERICDELGADRSLVTFVPDRPGHDLAYGLDWSRLEALGWSPRTPFADGLAMTLAWYRDHQGWVADVLAGAPA